jgi:hypothetical protein
MDPTEEYFSLEREVTAYRTAALVMLVIVAALVALTC